MSVKLVFDGALFSECERMGSNRYGMLRLAESITRELIKNNELEISFANRFYTGQYDELLRKYLAANYPAQTARILSRKPFFQSNIPKLRGLLKRFAERARLQPSIGGLEDNELFHSYYYAFPARVSASRIKKSLTFLDIIPLKVEGYDDYLIETTKEIVSAVVPNFALSISEFSRQDLIDYDKRISPDRVFVSPPAAAPELFYENRNAGDWQIVKNKYNLPDNYFLSVSSRDHRKNIPHLVRCFSRYVLQEKPDDLYLVLTGNFNYSAGLLDELKIEKTARDRIFIAESHIEDEDLAIVYSNARCFFFMSYYEGFGLPALEAMQCGVPVITANTTSLPEVVGDAGIMLDPHDEDALCDAMREINADEELRKDYARRGLKRAELFSWKRCARQYTEIFKTITSSF